jgi:RNA polymerase sigma-70 factor, ECF subfamily
VTATARKTEPDDRRQHDQRDRELFDAWHAGDRRAGDRLIKHYFPRLRVYFIGRASGEHEDLMQETFTRVMAKYDAYRGGSFRSFLFGVARMVFFEYLRRCYSLRNIDPWTDSLSELGKGNMSSRLAEREHHRLLLDALSSLPLDDQDLLELYYWQRLKARELAEIFEVVEPTIRGRIRAALKRLGATFAEVAGNPHGTEYSAEELEAWLDELRGVLKRGKSS